MHGYSGIGHYYANKHYDRSCPECLGTGAAEFKDGFVLPCHACGGDGLRKDPPLPLWAKIGMTLLGMASLAAVVLAVIRIVQRFF